jgi:hypothetical protein
METVSTYRLTVRDLETVGKALFGERWQTPLAEALKVNDRTVRRWIAGDREPGADTVDDLLRIARTRAGEISKAVALLERAKKISAG